MIQFDEITGNFPGWEYVILGAGLVLLLVSAFIFTRFMRALKKGDLYSFKTVALLGFFIYFMVLSIFNIRYYFLYMNTTFYLYLVSLIFSLGSFMLVLRPLLAAFAFALLLSNVFLIKKEGFYPSNLYASAIALVMGFAVVLSFLHEKNAVSLGLSNELTNCWYAVFCYLSCLFLSVCVCALIAAVRTPEYNKDYVLILGCKVRSDGTLYPIVRGRTDRAIAFIEEEEKATGKKAVFLPSGGKGSDELLSEGEAMKRYLLERGVSPDRITAETESVNTQENMLFSKNLIAEEDAKVAFSTSDFHVFRSGMLARSLGWKIDGIGAKTKWYFWPNAFMREFIAMMAETWKKQIVMFAVICAVVIGITQFLYTF